MSLIKYKIYFYEYNNKSKSLSGGKIQDGPRCFFLFMWCLGRHNSQESIVCWCYAVIFRLYESPEDDPSVIETSSE
jgi:hypothetical protein